MRKDCRNFWPKKGAVEYNSVVIWAKNILKETLLEGGGEPKQKSGDYLKVSFTIKWWTGRPGVLRFMGSHRVGHDWATELNWTELSKQTSLMGCVCVCVCIHFTVSTENISGRKQNIRRKKWMAREQEWKGTSYILTILFYTLLILHYVNILPILKIKIPFIR